MDYNIILSNQAALGHFVSLGLDVDVSRAPDCQKGVKGKKADVNIAYDFLLEIISSTADVVQSYKPNFAFFEQFGEEGFGMLEDITDLIKKRFPHVLLIGDAKRGDIGKTNEFYMKALEKFDAFTIAPYLGGEANKPYFFNEQGKLRDKLAFVLCQTSNKGAEEFQNLWTMSFNPADKPDHVNSIDWFDYIAKAHKNHEILPLYQRVAKNAITWSPHVGLVTGATYPENMREVRRIIGEDRYLLIPGIGTQGGELHASLDAGMTRTGRVIINVSSSALYASSGPDFGEACREEIIKLNKQINDFRELKFNDVADSIH